VARATALRAVAAPPDGIRTTLWIGNSSRTYLPQPDTAALHLQADLKEAGIVAEIKKLDWSAYIKATQNGEHDMCLLGWMADINDPDDFLYVLLDKDNAVKGIANNVSFYTGERVHNLLVKAQRSFDWSVREMAYHEAQDQLLDDVPVVPLVTVPDLRVLRRNVRGYTIYPAGGEYFRHVSFEK
jgi:peptide/nickel transport system substrate-binding protein